MFEESLLVFARGSRPAALCGSSSVGEDVTGDQLELYFHSHFMHLAHAVIRSAAVGSSFPAAENLSSQKVILNQKLRS